MKRITLITILTLIQATGCLAQIDPNIPVTGRIVQKINAPGSITWPSQDVLSVRIEPDSLFPAGMTASVVTGGVRINVDPQSVGIHVAVFHLSAMTIPDVPDWTGPAMPRHTIAQVVWYVFPEADAPFMRGLGDVLVP